MTQAKATLHGNGDLRQTLVVVFLRGAADGLALMPPVGDDDYFRARPFTAVSKTAGLKLDDRFGLNPLMNALEPAVKEGALRLPAHYAPTQNLCYSTNPSLVSIQYQSQISKTLFVIWRREALVC